jgi:heat shock protein HtpX
MDPDLLARHKLNNILQSAGLIAGMTVLVGVLGWVVGGAHGVAWALFLGILALAVSPKVSPRVVLHLYGARPVHPRQAPRIYALLAELSERAQLPAVPTLYYVPSRMLNAFAVGRRNASAVALTDGLLRSLSLRELAGVLAHEISHVRHSDMWVMGLADVVSRVTGALSLAGQFLLLLNLPLLLLGQVTVPWLAVALLIAAPSLTALMQLALARNREYDADLGAVALTDDPHGLAAALRKLGDSRGGWLERVLLPGRGVPDPSLLRTHPATEQRIRRLLSLAPSSPRIQPGRDTEPATLSDLGPVHRRPRWHATGIWF